MRHIFDILLHREFIHKGGNPMERRSYLADKIMRDEARENYFKQKGIRQKCLKEGIKQCDICRYNRICTEVERECESKE